MNFFEAQDKAHKRTGLMVWALAIGMLGMTVGLYFICMLAIQVGGMYAQSQVEDAARQGQTIQQGALTRWAEKEMAARRLRKFLVAFALNQIPRTPMSVAH